jgi:hypothetical protein
MKFCMYKYPSIHSSIPTLSAYVFLPTQLPNHAPIQPMYAYSIELSFQTYKDNSLNPVISVYLLGL